MISYYAGFARVVVGEESRFQSFQFYSNKFFSIIMDNLPSCEFTAEEVSLWLKSNGFEEFSDKFYGELICIYCWHSIKLCNSCQRMFRKVFYNYTMK